MHKKGYIRLTATGPHGVRLMRLAEVENPDFSARLKRGAWTGGVERVLRFWVAGDALYLPAGLRASAAAIIGSDHDLALPPAVCASDAEAGLRPYQVAALRAACAARGGIVVAPCGSGKTVIGAALARACAPLGGGTLVLVHTRELAEQWACALLSVAPVWRVQGGRARLDEHGAPSGRLASASCVALVQSREHIPPQYLAEPAALIVDECHHASAKTYREIVGECGARLRFGLTATPQRADGLGVVAEMFLGPVTAVVRPDELQDAGHTVAFDYRRIDTEWSFPWSAGESLHPLIDAMVRDERRNAAIAALAAEQARGGRAVLVLSGRVEHACELAGLIAERGCDAHALTGRTPQRERGAVVERMRQGAPIVVCATSLADEGLDWPALSVLVLATPSRSAGKMVQRCGRVMRPAPGKPRPVVFDLVDDVPVLRGQAASRRKAIAELRAGA